MALDPINPTPAELRFTPGLAYRPQPVVRGRRDHLPGPATREAPADHCEEEANAGGVYCDAPGEHVVQGPPR